MLEDFFLVGAGNERAHFGGLVHTGADGDFFGGGGESRQERIGETALEEQAGTGAANLALTRKNREERILESVVVVGIRKHDVRALAAEFERDLFEIRGGGGKDFATGVTSSGESDFIHQRTLGEARAHRTAQSIHELRDAGWESRLVDQLEKQRGGEWRELGGLEDAAIPRCQTRSQLPCGHEKRVIPRNDLAADSDRLAHGLANYVRVSDFKCLPVRLRGKSGVVAEAGGGIRDIEAGFTERLAAVARFHFGKLDNARLDEIGEFEKATCPLWSWSPGPWTIVEGFAGGSHRFVHILNRGVRHLAELRVLGGVVKRTHISVPRWNECAVHIVF